MTGILLGLLTALGWGVGDFYGGVVSRRWPSLLVVLGSMVLATLVLIGAILIRGTGIHIGDDLIWAMTAGAIGVFSLTGFFRLLSRGNMAVSAPLTALTTAIVPVVFGIASSGWPSPTQSAGITIALFAIPLVAQGSGATSFYHTMRNAPLKILEPILVGVGFGVGLICLDQIDTRDLLAPLLIQRLTSIPLLLLILWWSPGRRLALQQGFGPIITAIRPAIIWLIIIGFCDTTANGAFILATQLGELTIAAVVGSLHPAVTVVMARFIDKEQLRRAQSAGLILSFISIVLISL